MAFVEAVSRTAPLGGVRRAVFTQGWAQLAYVHWRYDPALLEPFLPHGVRPDIVDGSAWVGLIPFTMQRIGILGVRPLPGVSSFLETNIRTYGVGPDGRRSVVFLTLEASRLLPVLAARVSYRLPYAWAAMTMRREGDTVSYASTRRWPNDRGATSQLTVRLGEPVLADAVDDALTARWGLHSRWYGGRTVWVPVDHEPWPLRAARLESVDDGLFHAVGLAPPRGEPRVLWSEGVHVRIGRPRRVSPASAGLPHVLRGPKACYE